MVALAVAAIYRPVFAGEGTLRGVAAIAIPAGIGGLAEAVGLFTGWPFGAYVYLGAPGSSVGWWPLVDLGQSHSYPLLVPLAWALVVGGCYGVVRSRIDGWPAVPLAALLAAAVDFVMEPVMTRSLGYWRWIDSGSLPGGAPWTNPVGWFVVTFMIAATIRGLGIDLGKVRDPAIVLLGHLVLTLGLGAVSLLPGPSHR